MNITPISSVLGARITGVDLRDPMGNDTFAQLEHALHTHGFIVLPEQKLSPLDMVAFARRWGRPEPHVDRKSTRLNSSHSQQSRMPSSA